MKTPRLNKAICNHLMAFLIIWHSKKKFSGAGNREYQKLDRLKSEPSSSESRPLWVFGHKGLNTFKRPKSC